MYISDKIWEFKQQKNDFDDLVKSIMKEFNLSSITAKVILNRGLTDFDEIKNFLNPDLNNFYDPFLLKDMSKAVERIIKAVERNEKIVIYGDYDVDGITSTSILVDCLGELSQNIEFYIPDRIEEGYGLSKSSIDKIAYSNTKLIITVDCGITAVEEIEYAKQHNVDVIVTDHHECKNNLPDACAVVNPKQSECKYPYKDLAGVGVVFKLIQALAQKINLENVIDKYVEIVALGTVADVVPLLDENRVIVKYGLEKLKQTENIGLKALVNVSGLEDKQISTTSIGYILAPRINAAGRIGDARKGVELFLNNDKDQAYQLALELDSNNRKRQQMENDILNEALEMISNNEEIENKKVFVLASEGWHNGVIGIVASRITEKFNKPTILISLDEEGKGSGRSISGFNLFEALMQCSNTLGKFGGHELAVGLSIDKKNISKFEKLINDYADKVLTKEDFYPRVKVDADICKENINFKLLNELKFLEPHGISNPSPVFLYNGLKILDSKTVGEDKHLKLKMEDKDLYIDAIGFNLGELDSKIDTFDKVDVVCSLEINSWNGQEKLQLNIKDLRTHHEIIFKERYYSTLENAIFGDFNIHGQESELFDKIEIYNEDILSLVKKKEKNLILINTLKGSKSFIKKLNNFKQEYKEMFKLFYNYIKESSNKRNIIVINPYLTNIDLSCFDNVILYDLCFSKKQYVYLINNSKQVYIMNDANDINNNIEVFNNIIPQRDELVKVYQYIKSRSNNQIFEENIYSLTREISISYNIDINSLKLKKILEIFQEMNLVNLNIQGDFYKIEIINSNNVKVNINKSKGLLKLIQIKDEFNYFIKYLKEKQIC